MVCEKRIFWDRKILAKRYFGKFWERAILRKGHSEKGTLLEDFLYLSGKFVINITYL